jgi:predicted dinucleotide-binding enzyme
VLALYYPGIKDAARQYADQLAGRVVVDVSNPIDTGLRPIDVGPLARAQELENLGFLHVWLQQPLGLKFASMFKLHSES